MNSLSVTTLSLSVSHHPVTLSVTTLSLSLSCRFVSELLGLLKCENEVVGGQVRWKEVVGEAKHSALVCACEGALSLHHNH